jgi:hypothetical protein
MSHIPTGLHSMLQEQFYLFNVLYYYYMGHAVAQLVEAPYYKPEGSVFDSR